jgi:nitroreductase
LYSQPITEIIRKRFSCRTCLDRPIDKEKRGKLAELAASTTTGPFGSRARFKLLSATEADRQALKGLGTYGFIRNPAGFIAGAVGEAGKNLEDFGYLMEQLVLFATDLGLGTCWLGGSFTRSSFAKKISARRGERIPAVVSVGHIADKAATVDAVIRQSASSDHRYRWDKLFFEASFGVPLSKAAAGAYGVPLDMVRLGPSASNKQPWRIVKGNGAWHFYLQRTPGYRQNLFSRLLRIDDMQRLDMGIAMCHFQLTAGELALKGEWAIQEPGIAKPDELTEYTASWVENT